MSNQQWVCYAWEGKSKTPSNNLISSSHTSHAEMNLLHSLQLKGI